ncbi:4-hydroxythreonine-4-phosphate dehydrogenase PdxA [Kushneria indalinina]|uniref:4-hydroxythreonine-4-phosphate dehydrogenase n=1 Tax=Kushneria indalinina DSM 14324 TaxID=1122140 RepID=A0A3D9DT48_9GAMM|nr:4-hydroxythreonine-4-phosphate dehydrogenase PdxA [Kushneria indalinina]REC93835.1 4-hydroxythreonine-4-phosphate dehydrogenase [Kushneria indalinina DSM 14324]
MTQTTSSGADRPLIALAMGDPAGISPELTARLAADPQVNAAARLVIIGDRRVFDEGARAAGLSPELVDTTLEALKTSAPDQVAFVDLGHLSPEEIEQGVPSLAGGTFCSRNFNEALALAGDGHVEAVCFTPFNKQAMRYANPDYDDEIRFVARAIGFEGKAREFNILDNIWNARVTSHIPLAKVAESLSSGAILEELALTDQCLRQSGIESPRIAVAGLNPHAGDGGNFGSEEEEIIAPAVEQAAERGIEAVGPFPADTVFLRAPREGYHAVLTMYHDQGQIAMKLMGFDSGVTMLGGFPFPVCTPAHGTAYDIAGRGIADIGASRQALLLAAKMASRLQQQAIA